MPPSPSFWHQEILTRVVLALRRWTESQTQPVTVAIAPLDVRFGPGRILQPDAMVFFARFGRDAAGPIDRVPEICIEVLSSDRTYDRIAKRSVYAAAGVAEYWIVDPAGLIERRTGPGLVNEEIAEERLMSPLLPGFEIDVLRLFSDVGR